MSKTAKIRALYVIGFIILFEAWLFKVIYSVPVDDFWAVNYMVFWAVYLMSAAYVFTEKF